MRMSPFYVPINSEFPLEHIEVEVKQMFAPEVFFIMAREKMRKDDCDPELYGIYPRHRFPLERAFIDPALNGWLAILDYFGFEEEYEKKFMDLTWGLDDLIVQYAYQDRDSEEDVRLFHGRKYTKDEFEKEFLTFVSKYRNTVR
jgi:hypothetical protein